MGLARRSCQVAAHIEKGRRARPAVEIFVGAAHRQIRLRAVEIDRHAAGGVAQIPQDQRACGVGLRRDRGHVVGVAAFEDRMGERHQGHIAV